MKQIKDSIKKIFGIPKTMVKEIDKTIDEKIEKKYEDLKTGVLQEDIKKRNKVRFYTGVIFILCLVIIVMIPITFVFAKVKQFVIETSIKSPNEIVLRLQNENIEDYPDVDESTGDYIVNPTAETVGSFWQGIDKKTNILLDHEELVLSKEVIENDSSTNFLQLQYDDEETIQIYNQDMTLFCMFNNPLLYTENNYIAENPFITLYSVPGQSQWEIFSFYTRNTDEMDMLLEQDGATALYNYLVIQSQYQSVEEDSDTEDEKIVHTVDDFTGHLLVISAKDTKKDTYYVIGAKLAEN